MPNRVEGPPVSFPVHYDPTEKKHPDSELQPIKEVVALGCGLSAKRIQALLKEGRVEGEFRPGEGRGHGKWYTSVAAVREYRHNLPTLAEYGRRGGLTAGRGRPKSKC